MDASNGILVLSRSTQFIERIESISDIHSDNTFQLRFSDELDQIPEATDLIAIDESFVKGNFLEELERLKNSFSPRPILPILEKLPANKQELDKIIQLCPNFLIGSEITAINWYNSIRNALKITSLQLDLVQQRQRYSSLFHNSIEPAFFLDQDLVITNINEAFLTEFNLRADFVLNRKLAGFIKSRTDKLKFKERLKNIGTGYINEEFQIQLAPRTKPFTGKVLLTRIIDQQYSQGKLQRDLIGYYGSIKNVSHEKRMLEMAQKSRQVAANSRLARTLAHEVRNPLTNINLAIGQLKEDLNGKEDLQLYFDIINRCTQRIDERISQLLSSSEQQVFSNTEEDVISDFKAAIQAARDRARLTESKIRSHFKLKEAVIKGDHEKLKIAFTNILANALESLQGKQGQIVCGSYQEDEFIALYVKDNGIGMDEDQRKHLFEPFYTGKKDGVGIGMTATQTIILEHGGEIEVESKPGKGSTFTIYLPLKKD